ncbi:MAG: phage replisome organizer N-terminal domain-containing protein, partial [Clostridia bacterium]|nr:phage replisome organizer N-terminal domain-containing protein [Clostridia bacterium]
HMIFVEDGTIYIKNWDVYQNLDKLEKIKEDNRKRSKDKRKKQGVMNYNM